MPTDAITIRPIDWRVRLARPTVDLQGPGIAPPGWELREYRSNTDGMPSLSSVILTYGDGLIVVRAPMGRIDTVRVNMPRLLHGGHGCLIKSPAEIKAAFDLLWAKLGEVAESLDGSRRFTLVNIELGWNFCTSFDELARRLYLAKNPFGTPPPSYTKGMEIIFRSAEASVKIYNKTRLMRQCKEAGRDAPEVTRFEVTLKSPRIKKRWGNKELTDLIPFDTAYRWLRECVGLIEVHPVPCAPKSMKVKLARICAEAVHRSFLIDGEPVLDFLNRGNCPKTVLERRRLAQAVSYQIDGFTWLSLFPEAGPPPPVEIPARKQSRPQ